MRFGPRRDSGDESIVDDVVQLLEGGDRLNAAGTSPDVARPPSAFAVLANTSGTSLLTTKPSLTAFSHVIEAESLTDLDGAHVFGSFQRAEFYAPAAVVWSEIAGAAKSAYAFADFPSPPPTEDAGPELVALDPASPLRREWSIIVDRPRGPMALSALERPDQDGVPDAERLFDSTWTTNPSAVRKAARICAIAAGAEQVLYELSLPVARDGRDASLAQHLLDRLLVALDG